ncbi:unnamed protein product [Lactuca virosa]|uniref:Retrotransposon gag domain-containing protein n=1 Tax=Lactuca virosa TaxID=75947 RepID=A0AAU9NMZ6_9ASTR|nr:unnamed protein product [Lactuca virosa]
MLLSFSRSYQLVSEQRFWQITVYRNTIHGVEMVNVDRITRLETDLAKLHQDLKDDREANSQRFNQVMKAITDLSVKLGVKLENLNNKEEEKKVDSKGFQHRSIEDSDEESKASVTEKSKGKEEEEEGNKSKSSSNFKQVDFWKIEMPIFNGEDSHGWIYQMERYYDIQGTKRMKQLKIASCMVGVTLAWYRSYENRTTFKSRVTLKQRLLTRFQPSYKGTFEKMAGHLGEFPKQTLEGTFIKRLEPSLKSSVTAMQSVGVTNAMRLAVMINENRVYEDKIENYGELGDDPQIQQYSTEEPIFPP